VSPTVLIHLVRKNDCADHGADVRYPNAQGAYGNAISSSDSANFLLLLQQLRAALPDGAIITLATQVWPFAGPNGSPLSDVSGFAAVIDWILIMNYDIWGCKLILLFSKACMAVSVPKE
jgi:GH18 family chitinase